MMNAEFREWEFWIMENYLRNQKNFLIDKFYKDYLDWPFWFDIHTYPNFIIVYLEDFKKDDDGTYQLLMDFFTFSDYSRFIDVFNNGERQELVEDNMIQRTTYFKIHNYRADETPVRGAHYYLDLRALKRLEPSFEKEESDGFPLLYTISLSRNQEIQAGSDVALLYQTTPLTYPQWLFSSLHNTNNPAAIADGVPVELLVRDVGQGNFNEVKADNKPYVFFDAGTEALGSASSFIGYKQKLEKELDLSELPMFVLSHWHIDHYSLLFALSDYYLKRIKYYVFPSYVRNLSAFLFVERLSYLGATVNMVKLPSSTPGLKKSINANLTLYANKYVISSANNSGLTLFVQGANNNAMLPGDCRYRLVESQANDAIAASMSSVNNHYLVVPHHGGFAGKVSYKLKHAYTIEGIVSVGALNSYNHPNPSVMSQLRPFLDGGVVMTMSVGDVARGL